MALSYEEALATLQSMFSEPWNRETLDAVLRHYQGHMENTVDFLLRHAEKDPNTVVEQLKAGINPDQSAIDRDAELARALANGGTAAVAAPVGTNENSILPADFLRIPGMETTYPSHTLESDEALARALQNEMMVSEGASQRQAGGANRRAVTSRAGVATRQPQQGGGPPQINPQQILGKISEIGDNARKGLTEAGDNARRGLTVLAARFNEARLKHTNGGNAAQQQPAQAERRGLLDDGEDHETDDMELMGTRQL